MALSDIEMIRLITQDNGRLPIFDPDQPPVFIMTDEEIGGYLAMCNGDVLQASRWGLHTMKQWISGVNTKELYGDVEVWSDFGKNYIKAADAFLNDKSLFSGLPKGVMPWAAGISVADYWASVNDTDNPRLYDWLYTRNFKPNLEGEDSGKWEM